MPQSASARSGVIIPFTTVCGRVAGLGPNWFLVRSRILSNFFQDGSFLGVEAKGLN